MPLAVDAKLKYTAVFDPDIPQTGRRHKTSRCTAKFSTDNGVKTNMKQSMAMYFGEFLGTFLLVTMIFLLTEGCNVGRPSEGVSPVFIGGTVSVLIDITAPLTQTGINPARDFGPRIIAYLAGWGHIAIPGPRGGFFLVYIIALLLGGAAVAACFRFVISSLMDARGCEEICTCNAENARQIA